jgi:acetyltransferase-like isoleucine patch superfamily enzyme
MMRIRYYIQKLFGRWLDKPLIPNGKTTGYSLVRSERSNTVLCTNTKVYVPFFLHNVELGDYSYIAKNSTINNCKIGKFCSIGPNFCCGLGIHPTNGLSTAPMFYSTAKQNGISLCEDNKIEESKRTTIGNDVFIGANVTILDGVTIADGAVIGAGAVVTKDIPPYAVAVGVPAKVVKYRFDEDTIKTLLEQQWWNGTEEDLQIVERNFWNVEAFLRELDKV